MKSRYLVYMITIMNIMLTIIGVVVIVISRIGISPETRTITLTGETTIYAGEEWNLHIKVPEGVARSYIQAVLLNGLQRIEKNLIPDINGHVIWHIPEDVIIYAGESLVVIKQDTSEARYSLKVLTQQSYSVEPLTTANSLRAYGEEQGMVIALILDVWGNAVADYTDAEMSYRYPNGEQSTHTIATRNGLAWMWLNSLGRPGRLRVSVQVSEAEPEQLEIIQVAGLPDKIALSLVPDCVFNDGRDIVILTAQVKDSFGETVADGTFVRFVWSNGEGYAAVSNGHAILRLPAPAIAGNYVYQAWSGNTVSSDANLQVSEQECNQ